MLSCRSQGPGFGETPWSGPAAAHPGREPACSVSAGCLQSGEPAAPWPGSALHGPVKVESESGRTSNESADS